MEVKSLIDSVTALFPKWEHVKLRNESGVYAERWRGKSGEVVLSERHGSAYIAGVRMKAAFVVDDKDQANAFVKEAEFLARVGG